MKIYITKKDAENEYNIISVSDNLVTEFEETNKEGILIEGSSIQEVMIKFAATDKDPDVPFNPVMQKLRDKKS